MVFKKIVKKITKHKLIDLYWNKKYSQYKIAKYFNVSQGLICLCMKKYNIKVRNKSELTLGKNNPFYGKKQPRINGKFVKEVVLS